jgi:hypothetical protein
MKREITYITDEDFEKLTKKQKLQLESNWNFTEEEISKLVLIPTNEKNDGYCLGHFFAYTKNKGWWKPTVYDCWQIVTDIENPATLRYQILKGDFENGGVQIFGFLDEFHQAYISYGGQIIIKKKK